MSLRSVHYSVARLLRRRRSMRFTSSRSNPVIDRTFQVVESDSEGESVLVAITPDLATCGRCLSEFRDPQDRRFAYALSGCTDCGPRFTQLVAPPFDRDRTAMAIFPPCPDCLAEYASPADRRFHAQNIACARCGPGLWLEDAGGPTERSTGQATMRAVLARAGEWLRSGRIVAVKGIGGFHLLCDATVERRRPPIAPAQAARRETAGRAFCRSSPARAACCFVDDAEWAALSAAAAPIVVLNRRPESTVAEGVTPGWAPSAHFWPIHCCTVSWRGWPIGRWLPPVPMRAMSRCQFDNGAARARLAEVADHFLMNDRPIVRHADDSVVRLIGGRPVPIRVGRGLAPVRLASDRAPCRRSWRRAGHLKSAIALSRGREILLGQHIGDLATAAARRRYRETVADFCQLLGVKPERIVCDRHPDYFTTRFARESELPVIAVQHHHAHITVMPGRVRRVRAGFGNRLGWHRLRRRRHDLGRRVFAGRRRSIRADRLALAVSAGGRRPRGPRAAAVGRGCLF